MPSFHSFENVIIYVITSSSENSVDNVSNKGQIR